MKAKTLVVGAALLLAAGPAAAHHSFAMFDRSKEMTLTGTVKEFQWTNPHSWIQLRVAAADGKVTEWSIEHGSPNALGRKGWKSKSLKPGDKVSVVINPLKDGSNGGALKTLTLPDGRTLT